MQTRRMCPDIEDFYTEEFYAEDFFQEEFHSEEPEIFPPKENLSSYKDKFLSPGHRILHVVDEHLPRSITALKLSITASCLVEDLSLLFPQIPIELCRATIGKAEALVPVICDLQIFNSPQIGSFSEDCIRITDAAIVKGDVKENEWYQSLVDEIAGALEDYALALPLTVGNVAASQNSIQVRSNFSFEIPPGEKQRFFTNFRMPRYKATVKAESKYTLKKSVFSSGECEQPDIKDSLRWISDHFPSGGLARPGKRNITCSNAKIITWVETWLPTRFTDHCFEGLFSQPGGKTPARIKLTILNNTNETIVVTEGEVIATLTKIESKRI